MAVAWAAELWAKGMNVWPFLAFEEERVGHLLGQTEMKGTGRELDCDCEEGGKEGLAQDEFVGNSLQYQERRVEVSRVDQGLDFSQGGGKGIPGKGLWVYRNMAVEVLLL